MYYPFSLQLILTLDWNAKIIYNVITYTHQLVHMEPFLIPPPCYFSLFA